MKKITKQQLIEATLKGINSHPAIALKKTMDKENASINNSAVKEIMTKADLFNKLESEKEIKPISLTGENEDYYGMEDIKYDNEPSKEWKEKRKKDLTDSSEQIIKNANYRKDVRDNRPMYAKDEQPITNEKQKSKKSLAFESLIKNEDKVEGNVFIVETSDVKSYVRWENNAPLILFEQDKTLAEKQKEIYFKLANYEIGQKNKTSRKLNKNEEVFLNESINKVREIIKNSELKKTEQLVKEAEEKGDGIVESRSTGVGVYNPGMHFSLVKYIVKKLVNNETINVNDMIIGATETISNPNYDVKKHTISYDSLESRFKGIQIEQGKIVGIFGDFCFVTPETANQPNPTIVGYPEFDNDGNLITRVDLQQPTKMRTEKPGIRGVIFGGIKEKPEFKEFYNSIQEYGEQLGYTQDQINTIISNDQIRTDIPTFYYVYKNILDSDYPNSTGKIDNLLNQIQIVLGKKPGKIAGSDPKIKNQKMVDILKSIDERNISTPEELFNSLLDLTDSKKDVEKTSKDIMNEPASDNVVLRYVKSDRDKKLLSINKLKFLNKTLNGIFGLNAYGQVTNKKIEKAESDVNDFKIVDKNETKRRVQTRDFFSGLLAKNSGKTFSIVMKNVIGYDGDKEEKFRFERSVMSVDSGKIKFAEIDNQTFDVENFKK